jgi:hypothetical protein
MSRSPLKVNGLHGVIFQNIILFITTAVRTSNPTIIFFIFDIKCEIRRQFSAESLNSDQTTLDFMWNRPIFKIISIFKNKPTFSAKIILYKFYTAVGITAELNFGVHGMKNENN